MFKGSNNFWTNFTKFFCIWCTFLDAQSRFILKSSLELNSVIQYKTVSSRIKNQSVLELGLDWCLVISLLYLPKILQSCPPYHPYRSLPLILLYPHIKYGLHPPPPIPFHQTRGGNLWSAPRSACIINCK